MKERILELDGVRGLAIAGVLVVHCFLFRPNSPLTTFLLSFTHMGGLGVDLFFVLSGYLITGILLRSRDDPHYFRNFYLRRSLRIFPAYYFVLLITIYLLPLLSPELQKANLDEKLPWFLFYMQNWYMSLAGHPFAWTGVDHFWSLAIEEQFYLVWPMVVLLLPRNSFRIFCMVLIAFALAGKLLLAQAGTDWVWAIYVSTPTRIDGLCFGALIATLTTGPPIMVSRLIRWLGWTGWLALAALVVTGPHLNSVPALVVSTTAATFAFGSLIFLIHTRRLHAYLRHLLCSAPLTWLGRYSYGIYLIHNVVYWLVMEAVIAWLPQLQPMQQNPGLILVGVLTILLTLPLATLMFRFVEAPALRQKKRFQPLQAVKL